MAQTTFSWIGAGGATPWYDESNLDVTGPPNQKDSGGSGNRLGTEEEDAVVIFDSATAENGYMPTDTLQVSTDWFGRGKRSLDAGLLIAEWNSQSWEF
ncbi:MAG: hypothetical protein ACON4R_05215 [Akkermansiaceae bacterium]